MDTNFTKMVPNFLIFVQHAMFMCLLVASCVRSFEVFTEDSGARIQASKVLLVITDGVSDDAKNLESAIEQAAKKNIIRYAIGVRSRYIPIFYRQLWGFTFKKIIQF